ncbi:glycosyltransferase [Hansschlegelia sp.]|uniref:glycosyltransferase n=1 Tax=Hansschlegelia sp. TaxID=2041892 RepID=UPI002D0A85F5|nr:glycosyltransferase [Hansschlegelia sp.]HVI27557.1 glycosyltransferase [Hansschlegelia sp.]
MMRVLVVSIGTYGDVLPFIAMAAELSRRGHDVTLASAETFEAPARRAGVDFKPLMSAADYAGLFNHPDFWRPWAGPRRLFAALPDLVRPTYDFIARNHVPGETVVVASALALGARVAEEVLGAPVVWAHLTPILLPSRHEPPRLPFLPLPRWLPRSLKWKLQTGAYKFAIAPRLRPRLNAFRSELGLSPIKNLRKWWRPRRRMALLFPDWFAAPQPDWPGQARQLDFPRADLFGARSERLDPALQEFLEAGEPPIAVTFGSARFGSDKLYRAAIEACVRLGRRCVVLSQQPMEALKGLEHAAFFTEYAPLSEVLPRCAALVHHGGVGTVSLAFAAGAPQLIVPMAFDQFDHAARVRRLGCGASVSRRRFSARRAADVLSRMLVSPEVAERCAGVAARCGRTDAIVDACNLIESEGAPRAVATPARRRRSI